MKTIITAFLTVFTFVSANAQLGIEWENTIRTNGDDYVTGVKQTSDGGYILGVTSYSTALLDKTENSLGSSDYWILKLNNTGAIQWQNTIGGSGTDNLSSILQTNDGGYIAGGSSASPVSGDKAVASRGQADYWIVKLDNTGNIQWQKAYGGVGTETLAKLQQTADHGYILAGYSNSAISGDKTEASQGGYDYWIVKIDSVGTIQWQNTIGGNAADQVRDIQQTTDGGYIVGGLSYSGASGDKTEPNRGTFYYDYWVLKLDNTGNIQWQKTLGGDYEDGVFSVLQAPDGGYLVGGTSSSFETDDKTAPRQGAYDFWVIKLNTSGAIQWQKVYGGVDVDELRDMDNTADGGFILGGFSDSPASGNKTAPLKISTDFYWGASDFWVIKIDGTGNIQWQNTYGSRSVDQLASIEQTSDGGYITAGSLSWFNGTLAASCDRAENGFSDRESWVVKLPAFPEEAVVVTTPDPILRGQELDIQFSALNFEFSQGTGIYLQHATTGSAIFPSAQSYPNDTTAVGTFIIPLFPCGKYNLVTECYIAYDAVVIDCAPLVVTADPSSASRCSGQLQINFTAENFYFVAGSPIYLDNGVSQIYPDTFITLNDSSVVGFFTFSSSDSCGFYALRHFALDSFPDVFELLCTGCAEISGYIYNDVNHNCIQDNGEIPLENVLVQVRNGPNIVYATTDSTGFYSVAVGTGTYDVEATPPNSLWSSSPCSSLLQSATVNNVGDSITINFPMFGPVLCPELQVNLTSHFLRRCSTIPFKYTVNYCNNGTDVADNAYIEITIPPEMTAVMGSLPWRTPQSGSVYYFDLGDVASGECGFFYIYFNVSCDAAVGQTLCVLAHIYPDTLCTPPDTSWDHASIVVEGECIDNDTVMFRISNVGTGNMQDSLNYYIVEDNVMLRTGKFKLDIGGQHKTWELANGSTFRIDVQQSPGHPGRSKPSTVVEACGTNSTGGVSQRLVNQLSRDEEDEFVDIACEEVIASADPNDKIGYPTGIGASKIVSSTTEMEYKIRFQNTGNDTAFRVIIRDTLSPYLDITTFELGSSSHPNDFSIYGNRILEWKFDSILLPDSNVNEAESHGFVQFRVQQAPNNPEGTLIENSAEIYFDFNAGVRTNVEFNTVGDINKALTSVIETFDLQNSIHIYPNPFDDFLTVEITGTPYQCEFEIYDLQGRLLRKYLVPPASKFNLTGLNLEQGMYLYKVIANKRNVGAGKIIGY